MGRHKRKRIKTKHNDKNGETSESKPLNARESQKKYAEIVKQNEYFEAYYKRQSIVDDNEWNTFMSIVTQPLPSSFRITSYCHDQANVLRKIVESNYFKELITSNNDGDVSRALTCLEWYPNRLAWQMNHLSRVDIKKSDSLRKLQNFLISETDSGYISRQEAVSMIPPLLLDIKPNHKVLDMCAAPGSKTAQIIEMLHSTNKESQLNVSGVVVANDVDNKRCYMLVHQSKRLHSACTVITNHDAGNMPNFYENIDGNRKIVKFDRILCDAPCSGDGTIRKNYDVWTKWNVAHGNNFNGIQYRIAKRGLEMLKKDGRMVYSTCSFNPVEDEAIISNLIASSNGGVELVDVSDLLEGLKYKNGLQNWVVMTREMQIVNTCDDVEDKYKSQIRSTLFPPPNVQQLNLDRCVRILPHFQDTGGFFVAVLKKTVECLPWECEKTDFQIVPKCETKPNESKPKLIWRKGRMMGYTEDPFIFFDQNESDWISIRDNYNINEEFPCNQLVHRCTVGKKRNIYFVTSAAKKLISDNADTIRFINAGVRIFSRSDDKANPCPFRVSQEGLLTIYPFLKHENLLFINGDEIILLLSKDRVPMEEFSDSRQKEFEALKHGCCVMVYKKYDGDDIELFLPLCVWKGKTSMRAYIAKNEKIHFLRVCGANVDGIEPYRKE